MQRVYRQNISLQPLFLLFKYSKHVKPKNSLLYQQRQRCTHALSSDANLLEQEKVITEERSSTPTGLVYYTKMVAVSLFSNTNMAAVTSWAYAPQPRLQGPPSFSLEKVPRLWLVTCLCVQIKSAQRVGLSLQTVDWMNSVKLRVTVVSWPKTGRIKLETMEFTNAAFVILPIEKYGLILNQA